MGEKMYRVTEVGRIAGVTVRTLHHYHDIGLLIPAGRTDAGYREYSEDDLLRLHEILVGRELGLSLAEIQRMLDDPAHDRRATLLEQRARLEERARRNQAMLRSIDAALRALSDDARGTRTEPGTGDRLMDPKTIFDGFDPSEYEEEVKERWGDTDAYAESTRRTKRYTQADWERIKAEGGQVFTELVQVMAAGKSPDDPAAMDLAERYRLHIDRWFYPCSHRHHAALAEMYTADPRFQANLDRFGDGLAAFFADAIRANLARSDDLA